MATNRLAIPDLGRVFEGESLSGLSEWQLLERYLERRDEAAFEALVTRHGPMVLGVCRRALGFSPDAEDAFQATFLILVRRARDLGPRDAIGPWLYGVATRVAARARSRAARRNRREAAPLDFPVPDREGSTVDPELAEILDRELSRLPGKYRSPLVLCYLEGRTHEEAARDLRWPVGTVKGRLARARELLRSRLARRGFAPSTGAIVAVTSPDLGRILDRSLVERTVGASTRLAAGHSVAQAVSQSITTLVEGVQAAMFLSKIKWASLIVVATGFVATSAAVLGRQADEKPISSPPKPSGPPSQVPAQPGHPGSQGIADIDANHQEIRGNTEAGGANDPRSRQILEKLEEPISMSFANETPLEHVLKYIKQATTTKTYNGIPIYVDPIGLQEAERSMNSTIQIELEGVPLRRTLQLILTQLGLIYFVEDGILIITSDLSEGPLPPTMAVQSPIANRIEKAERGELGAGELKELIEVIRLRRQVKLMHENYDAPPPDGGAFAPPKQSGDFAGGHGGGGRQDLRRFPGEENISETKELLREVRELIRLLKQEKAGASKAEKPEKKPAEAK